ncbi:SurA N-terminal domain-containing protein [Geomicrobium sp. JCM 19055]|uniref:SurA N-terminal domain-containing protein n=1 Tax=Geomicrobium sp. JCM 19055 TaxID=1460649 RepID=UPI0005AA1106|nr:SurA N-terminal domain-containing protein [Geomicrobium sp. JCM 19055]
MKKKWLAGGFALMLSVGLVACGDEEQEQNEEADVENGEEQQASPEDEMPNPDFSELPEVVAEVNGTEISRDLFEDQYMFQMQQMMMFGMPMEGDELDPELSENIVQGLVGQELLEQAAEAEGVEATDDEIDEYVLMHYGQPGMEVEEIYSSIEEEQGVTADEVRDDLRTAVSADMYATNEADVEVTDEEVEEAYEQEVQQIEEMNAMMEEQQEEADEEEAPMHEPQEVPELEELEDELRQALQQEKEQEYVFNTLIPELQEENDVTIHI